jgi:DNA-binding LacI/PurR family transcriptional regulator
MWFSAPVRERGFSTMLVSGGNDPAREQTELETLLQFQVEGLILISHRLPEHTLARIATEVPCVTVTRDDVAVAGMDRVSNDDVAGAGLAVDHLVELGHREDCSSQRWGKPGVASARDGV